jgi:FlaA1/EpsC-like NDP-sugar epimerase
VLLTASAWVGAYWLRFESGWLPLTTEAPDIAYCLRNVPLVVLFSFVGYRLTGQYEVHRLRHFYEEMISVLKGTVFIALLMMATTFFTQDRYETRGGMLLFATLTLLFLLTWRRASWTAIRWLRSRGYNQAYALIVGTGRVARSTSRILRRATWLGIKPLGFVEDKPSEWTGDLDIIGGTADLQQLVEKYRVAYVFICLPFSRFQEMRHVFDRLSQTLTEVRLVADIPGPT